MKYIKEYSHEFYYEISQDEVLKIRDSQKMEPWLVGNSWKIFKTIDVDFIRYWHSIYWKDSSFNARALPKDNYSRRHEEKVFEIELFLRGFYSIEIEPLADEWFLIHAVLSNGYASPTTNGWYKCDQLEGVKKLLMDIIK